MMVAAQYRKASDELTAEPQHLELDLERNAEAPAIARAVARGRCHDLKLSGSVCQTLVLLVSEVVSNAVLHSSGPPDAAIALTAQITKQTIHISVTDAGEGFTPKPRDPARAEGGYGLYLLEKAADRWGVDCTEGTRVWFQLSRETPRQS
jgi:anti-sigma regulatory factor (Ser/Thr protein kinase)